jgi:Cu+-exporting ATPase
MDKKVVLDVKGMTCASCAQGIHRHLVAKGLEDVLVSFDSGEVEVGLTPAYPVERVIEEINGLGYKASMPGEKSGIPSTGFDWTSQEGQFLICAVLTFPLMMQHLLPDLGFLHPPVVQILLATPVLWIGMRHFGKSAWGSVKALHPNMDVLISMGSIAAYAYSCLVWIMHSVHAGGSLHLYFETSSSIITLLLLGNIIERRSLRKTLSSLEDLVRLQPRKAQRIVHAMSNQEATVEIDSQKLVTNDLILIRHGDQVPADGTVYEGSALLDEAMMTGESIPVSKDINDSVMSGTIVLQGHLKVIVQQTGGGTVLGKMIETIRKSAQRKPSIQRLGDKVSAVFVPVVVFIALITFFIAYFVSDLSSSDALLRAIAVLVVSCPCAMGLATPTAVAVGIGRAARAGILIKGGDTLERLQAVKTIVFDKTGTLTTGRIQVTNVHTYGDTERIDLASLIALLEQYSTHPYAHALVGHFEQKARPGSIIFQEVEEIPGLGIRAKDKDDNHYKIGAQRFAGDDTSGFFHHVYVNMNGKVIAGIDFEDPLRDESYSLIAGLKQKGIQCVLLSGDKKDVCEKIGKQLGMDAIYPEKLPHEKAAIIQTLQMKGRTAMVGDGINDAAALASADVGISVQRGADITLQTAEIVLLRSGDLRALMDAVHLSEETMRTIRQNLTWALLYNVVAIPMAAAGFLSPLLASFSMAFSDVVVIGNSLRIRAKKLPVLR